MHMGHNPAFEHYGMSRKHSIQTQTVKQTVHQPHSYPAVFCVAPQLLSWNSVA